MDDGLDFSDLDQFVPDVDSNGGAAGQQGGARATKRARADDEGEGAEDVGGAEAEVSEQAEPSDRGSDLEMEGADSGEGEDAWQ